MTRRSAALTAPLFAPLRAAVIEWRDGVPFSPEFADGYFSREGGLAETRHVFIEGNDLPRRFAALPPGACFVVGETGFGTGLNFVAAADCFLRHAPGTARLHFLSVEKHPLRPGDLARVLASWPGPGETARELLRRYPPLCPGFHRRRVHERISLTLAFGEAAGMLGEAEAAVDAWFLDGFAPARNAAMWNDPVFKELVRLSRPGATLATFTAAGLVRRGLEAAGFRMTPTPGYAGKREMLCGSLEGAAWRPARAARPAIAVVGAGLAGASLALACAERGMETTVFDPGGIARGASGNLAGVVYTTPSAHPTPQNRFYQTSFTHTLDLMARLGFPSGQDDGALEGVLQLPRDARQARRALDAVTSGLWPPELVREADSGPPGTLWFPAGGSVSPPRWCRLQLERARASVRDEAVEGLRPASDGGVWLLPARGPEQHFDHVILANAAGATPLLALPWMKLKNIRGQVTYLRATGASSGWRQTWCHSGYLTPALGGLHCAGATFDLRDARTEVRDEDHARNLEELERGLPEQWRALGGRACAIAGGRTGFRCQSTDFLPLAGALSGHPGLLLDIAHGSRGITSTALCAEVLASVLAEEPLPVDRTLREALAPERFIRRGQAGGRG